MIATRENFIRHFVRFMKYWGRIGSVVSHRTLSEMRVSSIRFSFNGLATRGRKNKLRVVIRKMPDHTDFLTYRPTEVCSWKRLALAILRNDHACKSLGFSARRLKK